MLTHAMRLHEWALRASVELVLAAPPFRSVLSVNSCNHARTIGGDYVDNGPGRAPKPQPPGTRPHPPKWRCSGSNPSSRHSFQTNCHPRQCLDSVHRRPGNNGTEDGTGCVLDELRLLRGKGSVERGEAGGVRKGDSGGKPRPVCGNPDEEYRASAGIGRRRRKRVLNAKIAVYLQRYAYSIGAVLDIAVICAEQRRKIRSHRRCFQRRCLRPEADPGPQPGYPRPPSLRLEGPGSPRSGQRLARQTRLYLLNQW
jgi:hypothetical protein